MNNLDILEFKILLANLDTIPNSLLSAIIQDPQFLNFDFGIDILYLIERGMSPSIIKSSTDLDNFYTYLDDIIDRALHYSSFQYSNEEILIYKKYFYYKIISSSIINIQKDKRIDFLSDMENILSIQVNTNSGAWIAKENLRLILLNFYTSEILTDTLITKIKNHLTIAKGNDLKRKELIENTLNQVFLT